MPVSAPAPSRLPAIWQRLIDLMQQAGVCTIFTEKRPAGRIWLKQYRPGGSVRHSANHASNSGSLGVGEAATCVGMFRSNVSYRPTDYVEPTGNRVAAPSPG